MIAVIVGVPDQISSADVKTLLHYPLRTVSQASPSDYQESRTPANLVRESREKYSWSGEVHDGVIESLSPPDGRVTHVARKCQKRSTPWPPIYLAAFP